MTAVGEGGRYSFMRRGNLLQSAKKHKRTSRYYSAVATLGSTAGVAGFLEAIDSGSLTAGPIVSTAIFLAGSTYVFIASIDKSRASDFYSWAATANINVINSIHSDSSWLFELGQLPTFEQAEGLNEHLENSRFVKIKAPGISDYYTSSDFVNQVTELAESEVQPPKDIETPSNNQQESSWRTPKEDDPSVTPATTTHIAFGLSPKPNGLNPAIAKLQTKLNSTDENVRGLTL